jgi:CRP/FNR family transcriptional regulator
MKLENFDFLEELDENEIKLLQENAKLVHFEAGSILFYQGDITEDILLLEKGDVKVYIQGNGTKEISLYTLHEHDQCIVNTTSAINKIPTIGSAVTLTSVTGYMVNREIITKLMSQNPKYQSYIFSLLTLRLDSVAKVLENVKFKQLDERIYDWLKEQNKNEIETTHEELANNIGSSRVVVSRTLKQMERDDIVELSRGKITLCN